MVTPRAARRSPSIRLRPPTLRALLALLALVTLAASACFIEVERGKYVQGRSLTVGVSQVRKLPHIGYSQKEPAGNSEKTVHYLIRPKDPDKNTLALAKVSVANHRSARVLLYVDSSAAYVDVKDTKLPQAVEKRQQALDPFKAREEVAAPVKDENIYAPFVWGTVQLDQDTQVSGWMVFEIPKEQEVLRFGWQQGENIVVRFTEP